MQINGTPITAGIRTDIRLFVANLPTGTRIELPMYVFRGTAPGPVLLLTASMHGDEVNGTETLRRMIRQELLMPQSGAVIAMPIVNVYGFLHNSRALPDGKDLNRSFPGSKSGSLARRLAHTLMNEVVVHADVGIDLHTGGARRTNYPQVRCNFDRPEALHLARAFGAPFLLHSAEIPGSFRQAACKTGLKTIVFEGGESQRFDEFAIDEAMLGIQRAMRALDMRPSAVPDRDTVLLQGSSWLRAREAGMFRPFVAAGEHVEQGQVLAHLGDPYGAQVRTIKARKTGYVIGLNNQPVVNAGDALMHIGVV